MGLSGSSVDLVRPIRVILATAALLVAALLIANRAAAQDVVHGRAIAQVWCSNCHRTDPGEQPAVREAAPTFRSIAERNTTTVDQLSAFLAVRHGDMPDLALTRREIRNVAAYILSLRRAK